MNRILAAPLAAFLTVCSACGDAPAQQGPEAGRTATTVFRTGETRPLAPSQGLDRTLLDSTIEAAETLPRLRSMIVLRNGEEEFAATFNDGAPLDQPANIKSASKSVLSALAGMAIARGILEGPDQPILSELADLAPARPDPRLARVTVGHLLSMQAGLERTSGEYYGAWVASPNWVRYALARPFVDEPGGRMLYSTGSSHLLSAMLTRASGRSTHALAQDWLAEPLGIRLPPWPRDPQGIYFGGNDMLMSPRALSRFGELYRLGGVLNGERLLPAGWVEESWTPRARSPWSGNAYGYGWFLTDMAGHPVRFAWGYGGQMLYIVPSLALTVAMTSDPSAPSDIGHIRALHDLVSEGLVPAVEAGATG